MGQGLILNGCSGYRESERSEQTLTMTLSGTSVRTRIVTVSGVANEVATYTGSTSKTWTRIGYLQSLLTGIPEDRFVFKQAGCCCRCRWELITGPSPGGLEFDVTHTVTGGFEDPINETVEEAVSLNTDLMYGAIGSLPVDGVACRSLDEEQASRTFPDYLRGHAEARRFHVYFSPGVYVPHYLTDVGSGGATRSGDDLGIDDYIYGEGCAEDQSFSRHLSFSYSDSEGSVTYESQYSLALS